MAGFRTMSDAGRIPPDHGAPVNRVALVAGRTVGRYQIVGVLGQGGFGITYRARDMQLGREVAIKEYLPAALAIRQDGSTVLPRSTEVADDFAWGRERFVAEGRTLASLEEAPAVVRVHDFLEANGTAYIVMELLRGETLERRVTLAGPLSPTDFDRLLWPLLDGLQKVHEAGFLHRDIKPANILLGADGKPALIDFGASRAAIAGRTMAMTAVFTPGYAAPEQFGTARQGPWTDIYGLAATLHCAIIGRAPSSAIDRLMTDRYERLAVLQPPGFALAVLLGIDAGLHLEAGARPQSIAAWRTLFSRQLPTGEKTVLMARLPTAGPPTAGPPTAGPPTAASIARVRHRTAWIAAGAALTLLLAGGYYLLAPLPQPPATAPKDDSKQALQQAETERQRLEAQARQLEAEAARRKAGEEARRKLAADAAQKKRLEEEARQREADAQARRQEENEAKTRPISSPQAAIDGTYGGSLTEASSTSGFGVRIASASLNLEGLTLSGVISYPRCGASPVSLTVSPSGEVSGAVGIPDAMACFPVRGTARGRVTARGIELELHGTGTVARGTLVKGKVASPVASAAVPTVFDGTYAGSLSSSLRSGGQGLRPLGAELRVSGDRLTGQLINPSCGTTDVALPVDDSGTIRGTVRIHDVGGCSLTDATVSGKVSANALTLDIRGITMSARGSLPRRAE